MSQKSGTKVDPKNANDAVASVEGQELLAEKAIRNHMMSAGAVGLVPIPLVDVAGITAVQVSLIRRLAEIYGTSYSERAVRNTIGSLVGGVAGHGLGVYTAMSVARFLPFGGLFSLASLSVVAGGTTYALGRVYQRHFDEGGSVSDVLVDNVSSFFTQQLESGRKLMSRKTTAEA
ncbi:YcjF family protein [Pseudopelagicola sp. nBUS_19]|uniref:YcjF family protein n=1 Tax=Pseudopelagicola sp. nBUS_19 TaxID=3395316 RepID=UPI003EBFC781